MIYGYARVSTKGQAKDGNSLDAQIQKLKENGVEENNIYIDSFTGSKMERPKFNELKETLKSGDILIVSKLDRFARSVGQASELITEMIDNGITINVLNLGVLSNDSISTLMRNILLSFAQFERDMIVQRTQEGKAVARANAEAKGEKFIEGRPPKYSDEKIQMALNLLKDHSYAQVTELTGISKSTHVKQQDISIKQKSIPRNSILDKAMSI